MQTQEAHRVGQHITKHSCFSLFILNITVYIYVRSNATVSSLVENLPMPETYISCIVELLKH